MTSLQLFHHFYIRFFQNLLLEANIFWDSKYYFCDILLGINQQNFLEYGSWEAMAIDWYFVMKRFHLEDEEMFLGNCRMDNHFYVILVSQYPSNILNSITFRSCPLVCHFQVLVLSLDHQIFFYLIFMLLVHLRINKKFELKRWNHATKRTGNGEVCFIS